MSDPRKGLPHPGIYFDIPDADYRAWDAVSQSALKLMDRSPAHCADYLAHGRPPTEATKFGTLFDAFLLEPTRYAEIAAVKPVGMKLSTKAGIKWKEEIAGTREPVSAEDGDAMNEMRRRIHGHPAAQEIFLDGRAQVSVFSELDLGDSAVLPIKARIDWVPNHSNALVDVKTTKDARPESFAMDAATFGYHVQAAFYLDIWNSIHPDSKACFVFVVVEKDPPHAVSVFNLDAEDIAAGRTKYLRLARKYYECQLRNDWPAYSEEIETLSLPEWARRAA
jgi:hypothetical protein